MMHILNYTKIAVLACIVLFAGSVFAEEKVAEEAIEGEPRVFFLGKDMNGAIRGSICGNCPELKLTITPKSRAFVDSRQVELKTMSETSQKPYLTFFDPKTKKVTRIYWKSK